MGGLENPPKHAYKIFEWSLRDKIYYKYKNLFLRNLTRRQKIKKSLIMISPNELNLKTFISSLGAPDNNSIKYIYKNRFKSDQNGHKYNPSIAAPDA